MKEIYRKLLLYIIILILFVNKGYSQTDVGFIYFINLIDSKENTFISVAGKSTSSSGIKFEKTAGAYNKYVGKHDIKITHKESKREKVIKLDVKKEVNYTFVIYSNNKYDSNGEVLDREIKVKIVTDIGRPGYCNFKAFSISSTPSVNLKVNKYDINVTNQKIESIEKVPGKYLVISSKEKEIYRKFMSKDLGGEYWLLIYDKLDKSIGFKVFFNYQRKLAKNRKKIKYIEGNDPDEVEKDKLHEEKKTNNN